MLYSYVMLDAFGPIPSILEIIVFGWIVTMIIEEIRQVNNESWPLKGQYLHDQQGTESEC